MSAGAKTDSGEPHGAPRIAIVHDWMLLGGAERVVEQLMLLYPDAPLYTSCISRTWRRKLASRRIVTGYLNWFPFRQLRKFLPGARSRWFEHLDFSKFDVVISSGSAEAKGIKTPPHVLHINYCNAPTHYYWSRYEEYMQRPGFGRLDPLARLGLRLMVGRRRAWDLQAAERPHVIIANSNHIQKEVKKYYDRESTVIHPPIDIARFAKHKSAPRAGFVTAGRQTPYKRFDLAVQAASQLGQKLTVVGNGPDHERLLKLAGKSVKFETAVADQDMPRFFQTAELFLFPGTDDFGITPLEAMAAGCPVIAYKSGGALDYVVPTETGLFFEPQTVEALQEAMQKALHTQWDEKRIAAHAATFGPEAFRTSMADFVQKTYADWIS